MKEEEEEKLKLKHLVEEPLVAMMRSKKSVFIIVSILCSRDGCWLFDGQCKIQNAILFITKRTGHITGKIVVEQHVDFTVLRMCPTDKKVPQKSLTHSHNLCSDVAYFILCQLPHSQA